MSQRRPDLSVGLLKFSTQAEVLKYLRDLAEFYQKEAEKYGDKLGSMLRTGPGEAAAAKDDKKDKKQDQKSKVGAGGWVRLGSLMLNTSNPASATTEVMYQLHEELKTKLARTREVIKALELNASTLIPQSATFQVFMRNGVPERIIVEAAEKKKAVFSFDANFRVV